MDSFFFNITDTRYKITVLHEEANGYLKRVDISNGIIFLESKLSECYKEIVLKNLDRMVIIAMVNSGELCMYDKVDEQVVSVKEGETAIFCSSRQDMTLSMQKSKDSDIFILFIADFFLKRYLSGRQNEPIDFLYHKIQKEVSLEEVNQLPIDALSLYSVEKLLHISAGDTMKSIRAEHHVVEFIIHRFGLLDIFTEDVTPDEVTLASKAKAILLQDFINPPTVKTLAHLCATNESKLKKVFKKAYRSTLYSYVQKLRLEEANLLLKEENMTIGEVAKKVGYRHQGHFSKLFFSTYGVYPKELMKR
ncbi:transcriptional regulator, AraC family [hydrothermal vent metagenome]|uniref:Transcriptional regulator, AraC family n=1 Tax=hydrothermal vent metagenome TaxID=652676 RepID=A0A1W1BXK4_9ZZZZ